MLIGRWSPSAAGDTICNALHDCPDGTLRAGFFLDILQQGFSANDAQQQLDIAIGWGRYAELFDYNTHTDQITAEADTEIPASALADGLQ